MGVWFSFCLALERPCMACGAVSGSHSAAPLRAAVCAEAEGTVRCLFEGLQLSKGSGSHSC